ncbi:rhomboid family intramembrane serine protease [Geomonas sp. Red32]|uniref:rhomboid family intramembrane serine protease n=1 Tax=Geomonas sp. Red32 TaxID=2912856 RepID=UPI00202D0818|nr:rhomboid family intramembrane serine protease [Geomonas sp. Red32]MCM0081549.1 rhomboid family intramembrane serine protease [Geomonas sp. Red32]
MRRSPGAPHRRYRLGYLQRPEAEPCEDGTLLPPEEVPAPPSPSFPAPVQDLSVPAKEEWVEIVPTQVDRFIRGALPSKRAHLWSLVLESRYITCRVEQGDGGFYLLVPASKQRQAVAELKSYVDENRNWPPPPPAVRPLIENALPALSVLLLLAIFYNITLLPVTIAGKVPDWVEIGKAQAGAIMDGEWWRVVTALTLHADWVHLFSNIGIGSIFIIFLCGDLGSGLAWTLILSSGVLGNLANAYFQLRGHSSIGFSTSVFGAVGLLGALAVARYRNHVRKRWLAPAAAALALLVLLGTEGKQTDLGAHLFGFGFGFLLGLVAEPLLARYGRPGPRLNFLLSVACAALVVGAWCAAIFLAD